MKFFFSGNEAVQNKQIRDRMITECPWRLQSCHSSYVSSMYKWLEDSVNLGVSQEVDIMLDSGAFTGWSLGHAIELSDLQHIYEDVQKKFQHLFKSIVYINLDVIPGFRNRKATKDEIDEALILSDINYAKLVSSLGAYVLPVHHQGEKWEHLSEMIATTKYICIAPLQTLAEKERVQWVRSVRDRLKNTDVITHGLATTGNTIIQANNWYSVDSSTWVVNGGFGNVFIISDNNLLKPVSISVESPRRHVANCHFDNMSKIDTEYMLNFIEEKGFDPKELAINHESRKLFNLIVMKQWSSTIKPEETTLQKGLFDV